MTHTNISWAEQTWNPITGCAKVSPGCKHCYAEKASQRLARIGGTASRYLPVVSEKGWTGNVRSHPKVLDAPGTPLRVRTPTTWFVGSMTDIFHEDVPFDFLAAMFAVMAACPQHRFMLLTKRPAQALKFFEYIEARSRVANGGQGTSPLAVCLHEGQGYSDHRKLREAIEILGQPWPLRNVAIGTSIETQEWADKRVPVLLQIPAYRRFLSVEPMLGPISLRLDPRLHQVIIGCESGHGRRPTKLEWIQNLALDVLDAPGIALHIKQATVCQICYGIAPSPDLPGQEIAGWSCTRPTTDGRYEPVCDSGVSRKVHGKNGPALVPLPGFVPVPGFRPREWREDIAW